MPSPSASGRITIEPRSNRPGRLVTESAKLSATAPLVSVCGKSTTPPGGTRTHPVRHERGAAGAPGMAAVVSCTTFDGTERGNPPTTAVPIDWFGDHRAGRRRARHGHANASAAAAITRASSVAEAAGARRGSGLSRFDVSRSLRHFSLPPRAKEHRKTGCGSRSPRASRIDPHAEGHERARRRRERSHRGADRARRTVGRRGDRAHRRRSAGERHRCHRRSGASCWPERRRSPPPP